MLVGLNSLGYIISIISKDVISLGNDMPRMSYGRGLTCHPQGYAVAVVMSCSTVRCYPDSTGAVYHHNNYT